MKSILLLLLTTLCFGFVADSHTNELRVTDNCCEPDVEVTCVLIKKVAPGYEIQQKHKQRIIEGSVSLLLQLPVKRGTDYMVRHQIQHRGHGMENTTRGLIVLNQAKDTVARTFFNGKNYEGFTYNPPKNDTLHLYLDPHENSLLQKEHKKKDVCAIVRCIEYVIATRRVSKE